MIANVPPLAPQPRAALIAGSTGFIGRRLLDVLLECGDFARVHALSRRPLPFDHPRLANRILQMEAVESRLTGVRCEVAFCCLGTTLRVAGSYADVRQVDIDLVMNFAAAAKLCGVQRFVVLSAAGAASDSRRRWLRHKADVERALLGAGFASLDILRPGPVLGQRGQPRLRELASSLLLPIVAPLLVGGLAKYRPIAAQKVALAMLGAARSQRRGTYVHSGRGLHKLVRQGHVSTRTTARSAGVATSPK